MWIRIIESVTDLKIFFVLSPYKTWVEINLVILLTRIRIHLLWIRIRIQLLRIHIAEIDGKDEKLGEKMDLKGWRRDKIHYTPIQG